jgi:hypothetical protein
MMIHSDLHIVILHSGMRLGIFIFLIFIFKQISINVILLLIQENHAILKKSKNIYSKDLFFLLIQILHVFKISCICVVID